MTTRILATFGPQRTGRMSQLTRFFWPVRLYLIFWLQSSSTRTLQKSERYCYTKKIVAFRSGNLFYVAGTVVSVRPLVRESDRQFSFCAICISQNNLEITSSGDDHNIFTEPNNVPRSSHGCITCWTFVGSCFLELVTFITLEWLSDLYPCIPRILLSSLYTSTLAYEISFSRKREADFERIFVRFIDNCAATKPSYTRFIASKFILETYRPFPTIVAF